MSDKNELDIKSDLQESIDMNQMKLELIKRKLPLVSAEEMRDHGLSKWYDTVITSYDKIAKSIMQEALDQSNKGYCYAKITIDELMPNRDFLIFIQYLESLGYTVQYSTDSGVLQLKIDWMIVREDPEPSSGGQK